MAVSLPSDLVADVMRGADPSRRNAAVARLESLGSDSTGFAALVDGVGPRASQPTASNDTLTSSPLSGPMAANSRERNHTDAYRGFERMVLRNLFESLLPDESSGAFGGGPSAGIWRSMAADQFAGVYADNGGIGITSLIASSGKDPSPQRDAQWPYFSLPSLQLPGQEG